MGGGRGTRLNPLTQVRCKPAVPLAGKYRLADIPISNCLNAGYNQILYRLSSIRLPCTAIYKSRISLILLAVVSLIFYRLSRQKEVAIGIKGLHAVRQNLHHFGVEGENDLCIILSGDQLFRMNLADFVKEHIEHHADVSIAANHCFRSS